MIKPFRQLLFFPFLMLFLGFVTPIQAAGSSPVIERIQRTGELVLGTTGTTPPLSMKQDNGQIVGMDVDIARLLADSLSVKLRIRTMPFTELIPALQAHKVDLVIANMTITPERNMQVAFVGPYMKSGKCTLSKNDTLAKAEQAADLNSPKLRISALAGSTSAAYVKQELPKVQLITMPDHDSAIKQVLNGKADMMLTEYPTCVATLKHYPDSGLVSMGSMLSYEPIGIALSPADPLFINLVENFLNQLEIAGGLEALQKRWLEQ
mgnify:CR=1 FL=1